MSIWPDWLHYRAKSTPDKPALVYGQRLWRYRALDREVDSLCAALLVRGVKPGDHVAVLLPNRPEFVLLIHALARLGAVLVPFNTRLTSDELGWQLRQSDSGFLIYDIKLASTVQSVDGLENRLIVLVDELEGNSQLLYEKQSPDAPNRAISDRPQSICYTSGTTGRPKGAVLTLGNHYYSATASAFRLGTLPEDRWLLCMPLYHVGGMAIVLRCCLYGTAVVLQPGFDEAAVAEALDEQQVTLISVVPTMLHRLLERGATALARSKLRCILVGGAAATRELVEACLALGLPLATTYGLTETTSQVVTAPPVDVVRKPGSVGKPLMFSKVQIIAESGEPLPSGTIGEIVVRGPTVMQGYYRQPEATAEALPDGALFTGDMGYLDDEGDLWVVQRRVDLIVSGGENVYPAEVEAVLRQHPAVSEVCVVGVPDAEWGQRVAALVVYRGDAPPPAEALRTFARERLAGYKQPRLIRFAESLPRTASGKVRREQVKQSLTGMATP